MILNPELLGQFLLIGLLIALSPGPSNAFLMAQTFAKGSHVGVKIAWGFVGAGVVHTLLVVAGVSVLLQTYPLAYQGVLLLGASYMLYLAWGAWQNARRTATALDEAPLTSLKHPPLLQALITEVLNPKVALFFLALIPQFADPTLSTPIWLQLLLLGLMYPLMGLPIDLMFVKGGDKVAGYFRHHPSAQRVIDGSAALVLSLLAMRLFWQWFQGL